MHGSHGYLISQFLSPNVNTRKDKWGGELLENRSRFSNKVIKKIRQECGTKNFIVGVKINTADYVQGGFSQQESL